MRSNTSLKWCQFRLRTLLAAVLIVQLACIVSPNLVRMYRQYEFRRRLNATAAILKADLANVTMRQPVDGPHSDGGFVYVEGPIGPVLQPGENADVSKPTTSSAAFAKPPDLTTPPR